MIAGLCTLALLGTARAEDLPVADPLATDPSATETLPLPSVRPGRVRAPRLGTTAFRTAIPAGPVSVSTRVALVQDFDGATIGELTLRGRLAWRYFGLAVEVAGTAAASDVWSGAGLGNTFVDARGIFGGPVATHALGLRGSIPTGIRGDPHGAIAWWGTVPEATVPTSGVAIAYDGVTERFAWHAHAGLHVGGWDFGYTNGLFDLGASFATVQPIALHWNVVIEVEALYSLSPLHLRALARHDFGHGWEVDAGLAVPVAVFFVDPTLQVLARVERRW
ncbi:MAG: hypothetical protein V4850_21240 [Myxococcota bacterium]